MERASKNKDQAEPRAKVTPDRSLTFVGLGNPKTA
jgi:hypothetical protein